MSRGNGTEQSYVLATKVLTKARRQNASISNALDTKLHHA
jgi:hypothetical protein